MLSRAPAVLEEAAACISCYTTPLPVLWSALSFEETPFNRKDQSGRSEVKQTSTVIGPRWENSNKQLTVAVCERASKWERQRGEPPSCKIRSLSAPSLFCWTGHIAHLLAHSPETWFNMGALCLGLSQHSNKSLLALLCLVELASW